MTPEISIESLSKYLQFYLVVDSNDTVVSLGGNMINGFSIPVNSKLFELFYVYENDRLLQSLKLINKGIPIKFRHKGNRIKDFYCELVSNDDNIHVFVSGSYISNDVNTSLNLHSSNANSLWQVISNNNADGLLQNAMDYYYANDVDIRQFTEILVEANSSITLSNQKGNVMWCNQHFCELTGRSYNEIIGIRPRHSMYGTKSIYVDTSYVDKNVQTGKPFYFENIGYHKSGKEYWFSTLVYPVYNNKNEIVGRIHIMKDITNVKLKELNAEENENILRLALDASNAGVWSYNIKLGDFYLSDKANSILELTEGKNKYSVDYIISLLSYRDRLLLSKSLSALSINEPNFDYELNIKTLISKKRITLKVKSKVIQWNSLNEAIVLVGTINDITKEKNYISEIEKQRLFYHSLLDKLPADVVMWTPDHRYRFINKTAITDDTVREWLIGKDDFDYCSFRGINIEIAKKRRAAFNKILEQKLPVRFIERFEKAGIFYKLRVMHPILDADGNVELVIGYGSDITEQIENEQYAKMQELRIKQFLDIAKEGIFRVNKDGSIEGYSNTLLSLLDINEIPVNSNIIEYFDSENKIILSQAISNLSQENKTVDGLIKNHSSSEKEKIYEFTLTLIEQDNSNVEILGRISDITDVFNNEKNLKANIEKEIYLNKYKSQFIRISSHELRTPLAIIKSNSELLDYYISSTTAVNNDKLRVYLERIVSQVDNMTEILNQLLMISKIEDGNLALSFAHVDLKNFIINEIAPRFIPYKDDRTLSISISDTIGLISADPSLLKLALFNLLQNAFKYSYDRPSPILKVDKYEKEIVIIITDFGIGVPEAELNKLFQSFYRASNVGTISGTGIGLVVVDFVVKKHGYSIDFNSVENEGTEVKITIPLEKSF